jgi:hypothetical protein
VEKTETEYYDSENDFQGFLYQIDLDEIETNETTEASGINYFGKTLELEEFFMLNINGSELDK